MILIPEIETVVVSPPRTGSRSLRRAVREKYPDAVMIYRHMEADGVPAGYDRRPKVGVARRPLARLWSLYNYLKTFDGAYPASYIERVRFSVSGRSFSEWVLTNLEPFTEPYDSSGNGRFYPQYNVMHCLPENRKSQFVYLRPDLGTEIYTYEAQLPELAKRLGLSALPHLNASGAPERPIVESAVTAYARQWFRWDVEVTGGLW